MNKTPGFSPEPHIYSTHRCVHLVRRAPFALDTTFDLMSSKGTGTSQGGSSNSGGGPMKELPTVTNDLGSCSDDEQGDAPFIAMGYHSDLDAIPDTLDNPEDECEAQHQAFERGRRGRDYKLDGQEGERCASGDPAILGRVQQADASSHKDRMAASDLLDVQEQQHHRRGSADPVRR